MANNDYGLAEKQGNTAWLACPDCATHFPVSLELLRSTAIECHCPACHREFFAPEPQSR